MLNISNKITLSIKQYQLIRVIASFVLAFVASQAIIFQNYIIPIACMLVVSLILLFLRRRVQGIIADERDYATAGKSALLAIQIYSWIAAISMFILYAFRDLNPSYEPVAMTLAFSTCILMLFYSFIFRYHHKIKFSERKTIFFIALIIFFLVLAIGGVRLFSGEDDWICKNGTWVAHGRPSFPAPAIECK